MKTNIKEPKKYTFIGKYKVPVYDYPPIGWKLDKGATTAPRGYEWWNNGESRFKGNEFKSGLVKDRWNRE